MEQDVKQAQEVQQVLIPEELPRVAGLTIESEYRPAREVGGDFFQIIPHANDGSVLIVVGDVTGKGLQAGMLVALIVGAIRAEAAHSNDPLTALNALNQRLCGRGEAHATGLALRVAQDGAVTLANAGHLPPYLNGKELPMEGALPLGMSPTAKFSLMHFQLAPGDRLLLMSDGVVEAQDKDGQLFGFDRVNKLLQQPITAAEIAAAAQNFGQQDDILVLRITREASGVSANSRGARIGDGVTHVPVPPTAKSKFPGMWTEKQSLASDDSSFTDNAGFALRQLLDLCSCGNFQFKLIIRQRMIKGKLLDRQHELIAIDRAVDGNFRRIRNAVEGAVGGVQRAGHQNSVRVILVLLKRQQIGATDMDDPLRHQLLAGSDAPQNAKLVVRLGHQVMRFWIAHDAGIAGDVDQVVRFHFLNQE